MEFLSQQIANVTKPLFTALWVWYRNDQKVILLVMLYHSPWSNSMNFEEIE